jgi:hypothetical protein
MNRAFGDVPWMAARWGGWYSLTTSMVLGAPAEHGRHGVPGRTDTMGAGEVQCSLHLQALTCG